MKTESTVRFGRWAEEATLRRLGERVIGADADDRAIGGRSEGRLLRIQSFQSLAKTTAEGNNRTGASSHRFFTEQRPMLSTLRVDLV